MSTSGTRKRWGSKRAPLVSVLLNPCLTIKVRSVLYCIVCVTYMRHFLSIDFVFSFNLDDFLVTLSVSEAAKGVPSLIHLLAQQGALNLNEIEEAIEKAREVMRKNEENSVFSMFGGVTWGDNNESDNGGESDVGEHPDAGGSDAPAAKKRKASAKKSAN